MRPAFLALVVLAVLPLVASAASAPSTPWLAFTKGGEPGTHFRFADVDVASAVRPGSAIAIDPGRPLNISIVLSPPANATWEIHGIRFGLLVGGSGSRPIAEQTQRFNVTVPPGFTVYLNRTADLASAKRLGTGMFLVELSVIDAKDRPLATQTFYVRLVGDPFLTAAGAVATVASVATGYGLWQIVRDVKEFHDARERHKKEEEEAKKLGKAVGLAKAALNLTGGAAGIVNLAGDKHKEAARMSKRTPVAWTATGLGLGGVCLSWAQFLGYVPVNFGQTLILMATVGAAFLTLSLIAVALYRRARARSTSASPGSEAPAGGREGAGGAN